MHTLLSLDEENLTEGTPPDDFQDFKAVLGDLSIHEGFLQRIILYGLLFSSSIWRLGGVCLRNRSVIVLEAEIFVSLDAKCRFVTHYD